MKPSLHTAWLLTLSVLAFYGLFLLPDVAFAAGSDLATGSFKCSGGKASGQLYSSGQCPTSISITNFFSFLICNFEQLSSNVMGHMYCGFIEALKPAVWAVATLAVLFFGISFTIGLTSLSRGGAAAFLVKLAFVIGFATNADILIGVGYKFFISGISDGVTIVLSRAGNGEVKTGSDVYKLMDNFLKQAFHFATDSIVSVQEGKPIDAATITARCKNAVFAVMAVMTFTFPLITYLGLMLIVRIALTFFRACFGYIYGIVGITFLTILSPIFLSFYLFRQTQNFFDKWLGYLVSFALQVVLLFAFMTFVLSMSVSNLTRNIADIIVFNSKAGETTSLRFPWEYCTLCDFKFVEKPQTGTSGSSATGGSGKEISPDSQDFLQKGALQCKDNPPKPLEATFVIAPQQKKAELNGLVKLAGTGLISLLVLAWIVERLLTMIPFMAQRLGSGMGAGYATQLGGTGGIATGARAVSMPGDSLMRDFEAGFQRGYGNVAMREVSGVENLTGKLGSTPGAMVEGMKQGFSVMASGRMVESKTSDGKVITSAADIKDAGLGSHFMRWLTDPGRFDR